MKLQKAKSKRSAINYPVWRKAILIKNYVEVAEAYSKTGWLGILDWYLQNTGKQMEVHLEISFEICLIKRQNNQNGWQ